MGWTHFQRKETITEDYTCPLSWQGPKTRRHQVRRVLKTSQSAAVAPRRSHTHIRFHRIFGYPIYMTSGQWESSAKKMCAEVFAPDTNESMRKMVGLRVRLPTNGD